MIHNIEDFAYRCNGMKYNLVKKALAESGFYQKTAKPTYKDKKCTVVWWHGHNEHRGKLTITYDLVELSPGMSTPGTIKSTEYIPPMEINK